MLFLKLSSAKILFRLKTESTPPTFMYNIKISLSLPHPLPPSLEEGAVTMCTLSVAARVTLQCGGWGWRVALSTTSPLLIRRVFSLFLLAQLRTSRTLGAPPGQFHFHWVKVRWNHFLQGVSSAHRHEPEPPGATPPSVTPCS